MRATSLVENWCWALPDAALFPEIGLRAAIAASMLLSRTNTCMLPLGLSPSESVSAPSSGWISRIVDGTRGARSNMSFAMIGTTFIFCRQAQHRVPIAAIAHPRCILTELSRGFSHSFGRIFGSFGCFPKCRIHYPAQLGFRCEVFGCHGSAWQTLTTRMATLIARGMMTGGTIQLVMDATRGMAGALFAGSYPRVRQPLWDCFDLQWSARRAAAPVLSARAIPRDV